MLTARSSPGLNLVGDNAKPSHTDTYSECLEFCDILLGCAGVNWAGTAAAAQSNCYPYSKFTGTYSQAPDSVIGGVPVAGPTNDTVAQSQLCPQYGGKPYTDVFGVTYNIGCGVNATGTELYNTQTDTLQGCLIHCTSYSTCVGVTFQGAEGSVFADSQTPNCFPRSSHGPLVPASDCNYAVLPS